MSKALVLGCRKCGRMVADIGDDRVLIASGGVPTQECEGEYEDMTDTPEAEHALRKKGYGQS